MIYHISTAELGKTFNLIEESVVNKLNIFYKMKNTCKATIYIKVFFSDIIVDVDLFSVFIMNLYRAAHLAEHLVLYYAFDEIKVSMVHCKIIWDLLDVSIVIEPNTWIFR